MVELETRFNQNEVYGKAFQYLCRIFRLYIHFMYAQTRSGVGIKLTEESLDIPYLMFANCITLCRATEQSARNVKCILDTAKY